MCVFFECNARTSNDAIINLPNTESIPVWTHQRNIDVVVEEHRAALFKRGLDQREAVLRSNFCCMLEKGLGNRKSWNSNLHEENIR